MIMDWLFVVVGLVILLLAGDALVKGAVNLSCVSVPALIVSRRSWPSAHRRPNC